MKYIAFIMAMFILSDATSACGISDMCCSEPSEQQETQTDNCCKSKSDTKDSNTTSSESACCQHAVLQMPVLTITLPIVNIPDLPNALKVSPVIFNHSTDFHDDIWQPPKHS